MNRLRVKIRLRHQKDFELTGKYIDQAGKLFYNTSY